MLLGNGNARYGTKKDLGNSQILTKSTPCQIQCSSRVTPQSCTMRYIFDALRNKVSKQPMWTVVTQWCAISS